MDARSRYCIESSGQTLRRSFLPHLGRFVAFISETTRSHGFAYEPELKVARELSRPFPSLLGRQHGIKPFPYSVFSSSADNPVAFHHSLDLGQAQVWLDRRPQNTNARWLEPVLGNFNEDALCAVRDHSLFNRLG
jgi:hypothetical protein